MHSLFKIQKVTARQVLDSKGTPTIEANVFTQWAVGSAMVPSGASTGRYEAVELRDHKKTYYHGKSVLNAVNHVNTLISKELQGVDVTKQKDIDRHMILLDGTPNKSRLGANAILAVSLATSRTAAQCVNAYLFDYIADKFGNKRLTLPVPFALMVEGGEHAGNALDFQEFMIAPIKAKSFAQATEIVAETYQVLKKVIEKKYGQTATNVGFEGGFAPPLHTAEQALDLITEALEISGHKRKAKIAIDSAASEFYHKGHYMGKTREWLLDYYKKLVKTYPIISLEDPFEQNDFHMFTQITKELGKKIQIVADDITVTNVDRITKAIQLKSANTLLLKVNQIGTLTEAMDAAKLAMKSKWKIMVSHRGGDTEDPYIADLAVGLGVGQLKIGAPCRSDRTCKYNQLLRIEELFGKRIKYAGWE
ncbi:MAG: phosphopyruvate hydratase [archaeon]